MTVTYDPQHPAYYDEADYRTELTRVFDLCHGCRLCWNLCPSFGSLFDLIDQHDGHAEALTAAEQDRIINECYQCKLCYVKCPYIPPHEWNLDFPRLALRGLAVQRRRRGGSVVDQFLGRTDLVGRVSTTVAPLANAVIGKAGSLPRRLMERTVGVAAQRVLPRYAGQRFSAWFKKRQRPAMDSPQASVVLFQTCLVEYQEPSIGKDTVKVYERNRIRCDIADGAVCCGMPWLDSGNVDAFLVQARKNVAALVDVARQGRDIVVLQPTCAYVLKKEYPSYLATGDAQAVASRTYDVSEYLVKLHTQPETSLDLTFPGETPERITWHLPCHLRAQNIGYKSRDLLQLTGAKVDVVSRCAGIDGMWGLRAANYELARKVAQPLKRDIEKAGGHLVMGDCHLANTAITEETGRRPVHPIQALARAYGIPEEE